MSKTNSKGAPRSASGRAPEDADGDLSRSQRLRLALNAATRLSKDRTVRVNRAPRQRRDIPAVEAVVLIDEIAAAADRIAAARDPYGYPIVRTDSEARMLRAVSRANGRLSISDVSRRLRISRQAAHGVVVAAARKGLIRLDTNPHDRRLIQIELTKRGRGDISAEQAGERIWAMTLLNGLDLGEMSRMSHILRVIRQRLVRNERDRVNR